MPTPCFSTGLSGCMFSPASCDRPILPSSFWSIMLSFMFLLLFPKTKGLLFFFSTMMAELFFSSRFRDPRTMLESGAAWGLLSGSELGGAWVFCLNRLRLRLPSRRCENCLACDGSWPGMTCSSTCCWKIFLLSKLPLLWSRRWRFCLRLPPMPAFWNRAYELGIYTPLLYDRALPPPWESRCCMFLYLPADARPYRFISSWSLLTCVCLNLFSLSILRYYSMMSSEYISSSSRTTTGPPPYIFCRRLHT